MRLSSTMVATGAASLLAAAGGAAAENLQSSPLDVEALFRVVNGAVIVSIMGVTTVARHTGAIPARWIPVVPMALGAACGWLVADDGMTVKQILTWSLLYSGAASIGYLFVWKTILKKGIEGADDE